EMSVTGYNIGARAAAALAEPPDGPIFQRLGGVARANGLAIVYGYPERAGDQVFNAVQAVGPDGRSLGNYRKTHLYGDLDRSLFSPGDALVVQLHLAGLRVGLLTCYDVEFPEAVRAHALAGTDLLVVPTGLMSPYEIVSTLLVPARALESQLVIAYANRCGTEAGLEFCGSSCVVGPDGRDLVRAGAREELVHADVDLDALRRSRAENPYLVDRRADLYAGDVAGSA
ncbi:MAG: 5-aminopentanamidase, partial [Frankiaceae bacterium]|nr:5-aminopentanamidase [Frankiaceae bacterium]